MESITNKLHHFLKTGDHVWIATVTSGAGISYEPGIVVGLEDAETSKTAQVFNTGSKKILETRLERLMPRFDHEATNSKESRPRTETESQSEDDPDLKPGPNPRLGAKPKPGTKLGSIETISEIKPKLKHGSKPGPGLLKPEAKPRLYPQSEPKPVPPEPKPQLDPYRTQLPAEDTLSASHSSKKDFKAGPRRRRFFVFLALVSLAFLVGALLAWRVLDNHSDDGGEGKGDNYNGTSDTTASSSSSSWSPWTSGNVGCSVTCGGGGLVYLFRRCLINSHDDDSGSDFVDGGGCEGTDRRMDECGKDSCPSATGTSNNWWSPWEESGLCTAAADADCQRPGYQVFSRRCLGNPEGVCQGLETKVEECWKTGCGEDPLFGSSSTHDIMILGGNTADRTMVEILGTSLESSSVCTVPANMPEIHSKGSVGAFHQGEAILCGGERSGRICHKYSFQSQSWNKAPFSLLKHRTEASGAMLRNGSWIVIGGKGFDGRPQSSTEMLLNNLFRQNLLWPEHVSGHCAAQLNDSHVFVAGGEKNSPESVVLNSAYFLEVHLARWDSLSNMRQGRIGHVCGFAMESGETFAVVAGGFENLEVEMLSLTTMKWIPGPGLPHEMNWAESTQGLIQQSH